MYLPDCYSMIFYHLIELPFIWLIDDVKFVLICLLDDLILGFCYINLDTVNRWTRTRIDYHSYITSEPTNQVCYCLFKYSCRPDAFHFFKKEAPAQLLSFEVSKIFKNTFFYRIPLVALLLKRWLLFSTEIIKYLHQWYVRFFYCLWKVFHSSFLSSYFHHSYYNSEENLFMKGILVRKSHCIMIREEFRLLSNINDEAESCYLFWQKALSWLMGSKYGLMMNVAKYSGSISNKTEVMLSVLAKKTHNQHLFSTMAVHVKWMTVLGL